ncbi:GntR family transcriptional regulator [Stella sp.]|uniref:GntR family transcriptional regulator n=1 Tax=Stella sp. TaxID=2912054 RepID=UPI0035AF0F41
MKSSDRSGRSDTDGAGESDAGPRSLGYQALTTLLADRIRRDYRPGQRLAPERVMAEEFGVNRHTVRRALQELERAGMIATVQGSGSVVVNKRISHRVTFQTRFTSSATAAGVAPETTVLRVTREPPAGDSEKCLQLHGSRPDGMIVTLRLADGHPVCWIRHLFGGLDVERIAADFRGGSLHEHLAGSLGIEFARRRSRVFADRATAADVRHLQIPRDLPVLCTNSVNVAADRAVWEVSLTRFRSDGVELEFDM